MRLLPCDGSPPASVSSWAMLDYFQFSETPVEVGHKAIGESQVVSNCHIISSMTAVDCAATSFAGLAPLGTFCEEH
jgi:hypothetical protein